MIQVLLDTNFLILCIKQRIHFDEEIKELIPEAEIVIPTQVILELKKMSEDEEKKYRLEDRERASLAIQLIKKYKEIKRKGKYADKAIIHYAEEKNYRKEKLFVATIDAELARKLQELTRIIKIRGLKKLIIE